MDRGTTLTYNLPQLQNLIKRNPLAYKEEFLLQWNHYSSTREIFRIHPDEHAKHFKELINFIGQVSNRCCSFSPRHDSWNSGKVAQCYPRETSNFPSDISSLLVESYGSLPTEVRQTLVQTYILLKKKNVISSMEFVGAFIFPAYTHG